MGKAAVTSVVLACGWQARSKRGPNSLCEVRRRRQVRVHQDERSEGSVGSVVIDGRRRGSILLNAGALRAQAREVLVSAALQNLLAPAQPCPHLPFDHPPHTARPGGARPAPRGDGGTCDGACRNDGACGDEEGSGGGQARDDARELLRRLRGALEPLARGGWDGGQDQGHGYLNQCMHCATQQQACKAEAAAAVHPLRLPQPQSLPEPQSESLAEARARVDAQHAKAKQAQDEYRRLQNDFAQLQQRRRSKGPARAVG